MAIVCDMLVPKSKPVECRAPQQLLTKTMREPEYPERPFRADERTRWWSPLMGISIALTALGVIASGCAATHIPNTTVPDNPENRRVIEFVEKYRHAMESRDAEKLVELASTRYFDDNGTPRTDDIYDHKRLQERLQSLFPANLLDVRYEIRYRHVVFEEPLVRVQFRYTASFRLKTPNGEERWARRVADNEMLLETDEKSGEYRILSGM